MLTIDDHPLLVCGVFATTFPAPLGELEISAAVRALLGDEGDAPVRRSEERRKAVRELLRHGGYKPTGRGKPASEYLVKAVLSGKLGTINPAVDCCNAVSLHSGLPISVVDLDKATGPFRIGIAGPVDVRVATGNDDAEER